MGLRDIPRTAIGGYIKVARWPLDRGLSQIVLVVLMVLVTYKDIARLF